MGHISSFWERFADGLSHLVGSISSFGGFPSHGHWSSHGHWDLWSDRSHRKVTTSGCLLSSAMAATSGPFQASGIEWHGGLKCCSFRVSFVVCLLLVFKVEGFFFFW